MADPHDPGGTFVNPPTSPAAFIEVDNDDYSDAFSNHISRDKTLRPKKSRKSTKREEKFGRSRSNSRSRPACMLDDPETPCAGNISTIVSDVSPFPSMSLIPPGQMAPITPTTPPSRYQASKPETSQNSVITQSPSLTPIGRQKYDHSDRGPYTVYIQYKDENDSPGSTLHPVTFGLFLQKRSREFPNVIDGSLKKMGRNRISVSFHSAADANSFLDSPTLGHNKYSAFIPTFNVTRMGIARGVPLDWSENDIIMNVRVPEGCGRVIKVRRLNYKAQLPGGSFSWKESQTVVLTFDGQILPSRVFLCYNSIPIELYSFPTIQCYNCCRFGHTKSTCRSKPRCFKCGLDHLGVTCTTSGDQGTCVLCLGSHAATSKSCPEAVRQNNIKKSMAADCLSYAEASKMYPSVKKSFADVTSSSAEVHKHYRKTVTINSRPPPPPRFGYDRAAHAALIRDDVPSSSNGNAYPKHFPSSESFIPELIKVLSSLIKLLSSVNPSMLSYAAPFLNNFLSSFNESVNSVEQS